MKTSMYRSAFALPLHCDSHVFRGHERFRNPCRWRCMDGRMMIMMMVMLSSQKNPSQTFQKRFNFADSASGATIFSESLPYMPRPHWIEQYFAKIGGRELLPEQKDGHPQNMLLPGTDRCWKGNKNRQENIRLQLTSCAQISRVVMHGYGTLPFFEVWGINVQEMKSCSEPHLHCCWVMMIVMKSCRLRRVHLIPRDKCWRTLRFSLYPREEEPEKEASSMHICQIIVN